MNIKNATITIIIINVIAFLLQILIPGFTEFFVLISKDVLIRPWILITSMFLHGNPTHLLFNMIGLYFFGQLLESRIGSKRFLGIYFGSGILAAIGASLFYPAALGASGGLMGILGVVVILMPNLKVLIYFMFPTPIWVACIIWVILDTFGIFFPSGTANIAHLVGLATGLIYGYSLKGEKRKIVKKIYNKNHLTERDMEEYMYSGRI
jgi:uncharacterized protein